VIISLSIQINIEARDNPDAAPGERQLSAYGAVKIRAITNYQPHFETEIVVDPLFTGKISLYVHSAVQKVFEIVEK